MARRRGTDYEALAAKVRFGLPDGLEARPVRRWTVDKLAILAYYLPSFASICQAQAGGWYFLDGFAGSGVNKVSGEQWYKGSAILGLSTHPAPTGAILLEKQPIPFQALDSRAASFPTPKFTRQGDCNRLISNALAEQFTNRHLPGFCVLDAEGLELEWETIKAVAGRRLPQYTPYELMVYFSTPGVARVGGLSGDLDWPRERFARLFGAEHREWESIAADYDAGRLAPGEAGTRYRELYAKQLRGLGYQYVIPRLIASERGAPVYHLLLATNHDLGNKLLTQASEVAFLNNLPLPRF